jgi:hypothetical protein
MEARSSQKVKVIIAIDFRFAVAVVMGKLYKEEVV